MENTDNKQQSATPWAIRLYENDKIRLNNLLEALPGTDKREKLMTIIGKAEVETSKNQASSEFLNQLQQYTTAIMQAATAQAAHAANAENLIRNEYEQTLAKKAAEIEALQKTIAERDEEIHQANTTIKEQKAKVSDAADKAEKYREKADALAIELQTAKSEAVAVAEIRKEYADRLRSTEKAAAKAVEEKNKAYTEKAAAYEKLAEVQKAADAASTDNAAQKATIDAQAARIAELKAQLAAATARAERAEAEKMQLFNNFLTAQQTQKTAKKAHHAEAEADFETTIEAKGQQQLPLNDTNK